jgi:hypothetical protein
MTNVLLLLLDLSLDRSKLGFVCPLHLGESSGILLLSQASSRLGSRLSSRSCSSFGLSRLKTETE